MIQENMYRERIVEPCLEEYERVLSHYETDREEKTTKIAEKRKAFEAGALVAIPRIALFCTNKCTLQCKECSVLIPHFKESIVLDAESVIRDLEMLLRGVDECFCVDICTGEILLYPHLEKVLDYCIRYPKVDMIELITNGIVLPKRWSRFCKTKRC